jgi:hypothetical protein
MRVPQDWTEHEFDDVFRRLRLKSYQIPTSDYEAKGKWPIVDQGKRTIAGYTSRDNPCDQHPFIVFGDHTCEVKFVDFRCFLGADGTQPLATTAVCDLNFGYQILGQVRLPALGYSRHFKELQETVFALPPLPEQRKIADILTTWDEALTQLDALIEAQERRKKALMQQLLTGKKRFPGFKGKWKTVNLRDVLEPITRPTAKPHGKFLAAGIRSHGKGVFLKHDFIPANIALDELFELKTGDLVVNITFAWEGAAAIVPPEADGALVSHRFPAFGFREGKAVRSFFRHYIRTHRFVFDCGLASPGGAGRNRVLSKSAFLDIELPLPPVEEQQKIGDILDTADQQLTLLRTQRTALDQQKRGLMQRLLTGRLRVKTTQTTP